MPRFEDGPALRIPHVVRGRSKARNRVTYVVDPDGVEPDRAIPEEVVLRRWRMRHTPGVTYSGTRLSPTLWRAWGAVLEREPKAATMTARVLASRLDALRPMLRQQHLKVPSAELIVALLQTCGAGRVKVLLDRYTQDGEKPRTGLPDLFLFARDRRGRPRSACFVEVKRPKEDIRSEQLEEIGFLRSLGLRARVLRLIER